MLRKGDGAQSRNSVSVLLQYDGVRKPPELPPMDSSGYAASRKPECAVDPLSTDAADYPRPSEVDEIVSAAGPGRADKGVSRAQSSWMWFLAFMRWSPEAVCEMSKGRGLYDDFHDYPDTANGSPDHFTTHKCVRCGKEFVI